jgi:MFS family permease
VSVAGTWMQTLALGLLVLHLTGSGTDLGLVTAARLVPFVVAGPVGGVIADRYDKRRLLYATQSASAVVAAAFAVLIWVGAVSVPLVAGLSLLLGCLTVLDNPARQSLISELVPRDQLRNAVTLNSVSLNVARVLGSAVGGTLVAAVGFAACFAFNAVSFVAVLVSLAVMDRRQLRPAPRQPRERGQVRAGLRYAVRTPALAVPLLMVTVSGTLAYEFPVTLPLVARGAFGGGAGTYGAMAAVMGVGAVVGGLVAAGRRRAARAASLSVAATGWGVAILAAAVAPTLPLELVALLFVGYGSITFNAQAKTSMQLAAEPAMRGRVMALWALAWSGSTAVGGPLVGWIAEQAGSRWSLVVGGAPTTLLGLLMLPALRRMDGSGRPRSPAGVEPVSDEPAGPQRASDASDGAEPASDAPAARR